MKTPRNTILLAVLLALALTAGCEPVDVRTTTVANKATQVDPATPHTTTSTPEPIVLYGKSIVDEYTASVVRIVDGDTLVVLNESKNQIKVRLEGIDTPEMGQPFGTQAKEALSELVLEVPVTVSATGSDRYGRTLGFIIINETNVNAELIKTGLAWHFKKYNTDEDLARLETEARNNRAGLWSAADPVAPWDWRKRK